MPIVKHNQAMPERPVILVIYGVPGAGKTSLANTSKNPLLVDCDRGGDRAIHRQDTLVCNCWEDVINEIEAFKDYDTICIDTVKALLDDFLADYCRRTDEVCRRNSQKMYGKMGDEFKAFVAKVRAMGKDIVFVAHAKDDKDGDQSKFYPDATGQSKDLILRVADQVGFLCVVNDQRVIRWEPTARTVGKNVAGLPPYQIPNEGQEGFDGCLDNIIRLTKQAIQARSNAQTETLSEVEVVQRLIEEIKTPDDAMLAWAGIAKLGSKANKDAATAVFRTKIKEVGISYDKKSKLFVKAE